jgi:putative Mn2+ efflux pump MntP
MTLRRFVYRYIYLKTPGWELTRQVAKRDKCDVEGCKRSILHLHHDTYTGFQVWYLAFRMTLLALFFGFGFSFVDLRAGLDVFFIAMFSMLVLALSPDLLSKFHTYCDYHHDLIHLQERTK